MLSIAYPGAMKYYYKTIRELPAGWGFADVIFIPKKASASLSAIAVEVKLENIIFKLLIGGSTASIACSMQVEKRETVIQRVAVLQALPAVCRSIKIKCKTARGHESCLVIIVLSAQ